MRIGMLVRALKWAVGVAASNAGTMAATTLFALYHLSALFASYPGHDGVFRPPPALWPQTEPRLLLSVALMGAALVAFGCWTSARGRRRSAGGR